MIKRIVKMGFKPEKVDEFKMLFEDNWQKIRSAEGCSHLELLVDENDATIFFTYSIWQTEDHLNAYRNSVLFEKVWQATKILFNKKPEVWSLKQLLF